MEKYNLSGIIINLKGERKIFWEIKKIEIPLNYLN